MKKLLLGLLFLNLVFFGYWKLVGEPGVGAPSPELANPVPRIALATEGRGAAARCQSLGPFADHAGAEQATKWLHDAERLARERSTEVDGPPTYWVALTTRTLQQAARIAIRLRAAGVGDVEVRPPEANGTEATLSLGLYTDRERAQRRVTDLRRYAVNPDVVEQLHKTTAWWVDVDVRPADPPLDAVALVKAVPAAAGTRIDPCPAPAEPAVPAPAAPAPAAPAPDGAPKPAAPAAPA